MATFGLVHGAWHGAWCFDGLVAELEKRGQRAVAVDLPRENADAGPAEYARAVADGLAGSGRPLVLVGHSLGGLTIANVAALIPVDRLVYLCALVPQPGRRWDETRLQGSMGSDEFNAAIEGRPDGSTIVSREVIGALYADSPAEVGLRAWERLGPQTYGITQKPSLDFPPTPATYIVGGHDRAILPEWARRTAREQLGVEPVEIDSDHSPFLGRPAELADLLLGLL